jgi:UDP-N-acetylglucosamine 2-epimerase
MYEAHFGMTGLPFQLSPDPNFYFDSRSHHGPLMELRAVLGRSSGFIVISGEIGAGKTTLVRALIDGLDLERVEVAQLVSTQLDADQLVSAVAIAFGIPVDAARPEAHAAELLSFLLKAGRQARTVLLVIDEAQHVDEAGLHRLLALLKYGGKRILLQVCLTGQPELREAIDHPGLAALRQQIVLSCHVGPIAPEETAAYVEHRLRKVGWSGVPRFETEAFDEIHRWTRGIPRRVNVLCNRLLLSRFIESEETIDAATVTRVASELGIELGSTGMLPFDWTHATLAPPATKPINGARRPGIAGRPRNRRPLLCVALDDGDHARAAALLRAFQSRPDPPNARLVRIRDDDSFARTAPLFEGLCPDRTVIVLGRQPQASAFEQVLLRARPCGVVVFDGSSAALACGRSADRFGIPLIHCDAGAREGGPLKEARGTRAAIDALAELLYTADAEASRTLVAEGVPAERVHCVGNLLIDALQFAVREPVNATFGRRWSPKVEPVLPARGAYALVVIEHRRNIGQRQPLVEVLAILRELARHISLVWPIQPRLMSQIERYRAEDLLDVRGVCRVPPQTFVDQVALLRNATCVVTDSWDLQDLATALSVPCVTIGVVPARPITVSVGSNRVAACDRALAARLLWDCLFKGGKRGRLPDLWDGKTGTRIAGHLAAGQLDRDSGERGIGE